MDGSGTTVAAPRTRLAWVDIAKGASIVLVVLLHVTYKHAVRLDDASQAIRDDWVTLCRWMRPVRMPLFFMMSGLLAASAIARRQARDIWQRASRSAELYVVWMLLATVVVDRELRPNVQTNSFDGFVDALRLPTGNLWYLWAIAAYVAVAALVPPRLRVPALVPLAALWLATASRWWQPEPRPRDLLQYAVWYAAGAYLPAVVRSVAEWFTLRRALAATFLFAVATAELRRFGGASVPVLQVLGVAAGIGVATQLRGRVADGLSVLGKRTLSIYVLHVPLLTVWAHVLRENHWRGTLPFGVLFWAYPLVVAALLISASLGLETGLRRLGAGRLFGDRKKKPTPADPKPEVVTS